MSDARAPAPRAAAPEHVAPGLAAAHPDVAPGPAAAPDDVAPGHTAAPEQAAPAAAAEEEPYTRALEQMNRFQEPEVRQLIADLSLPPGSRGLDVGCGVGLFALWLAEAVGPDGRVLGIEPSEERVAAARDLVGEASAGRVEFRPGDGTDIDAPDASFDWVWCANVLHHIQDTGTALREFARVLRPGGCIVIVESQLLPGLFLPGHPELEARLRAAEAAFSRDEGGEYSFQERRQRTPLSLREAGLEPISFRTYLTQRQAPLPESARDYIERVVFGRNWGPRIRPFLSPEDWWRRRELCEPSSPAFVLASPAYYCLYPISVAVARPPRTRPAAA